MTDFDSRILQDEAKEPPLPTTEAESEDSRRRIATATAMESQAAAPEAERAQEAAKAAVKATTDTIDKAALEQARAAEKQARGAQTGASTTEQKEPEAAGTVNTAEEDTEPRTASEHPAQTRRRALTAILIGLAMAPEDTPLSPLFAAYEGAPEAEVAHAAGAILTLYLRTDTETRRRLRPTLSTALQRAGSRTPLALALAARLGAAAMPPPAAPSPGPNP